MNFFGFAVLILSSITISLDASASVNCDTAVKNNIEIEKSKFDISSPMSQRFIKALNDPRAYEYGVTECNKEQKFRAGAIKWRCIANASTAKQLTECDGSH